MVSECPGLAHSPAGAIKIWSETPLASMTQMSLRSSNPSLMRHHGARREVLQSIFISEETLLNCFVELV